MIRLALLICLVCSPALAETVVATRTIRAQELIGPGDLEVRAVDMVGGVADPALLIGKEARVALYAGRPVRQGDVGTPAIVERNGILPLIYHSNGLWIETEGRALERAGPGERIRVMNLSSRTTVTARIAETGAAYVSN